MKLQGLTISNYKCFWKETKVNFNSRYCCIVGANNSGKTTLLEILRFGISASPHLSVDSIVTVGDKAPDTTVVSFEAEFEPEDVRRVASRLDRFHLPLPDRDVNYLEVLENTLAKKSNVIATLTSTTKGEANWDYRPSYSYPFRESGRLGGFRYDAMSKKFSFDGDTRGTIWPIAFAGELSAHLFTALRASLFVFDAQRRIPATQSVGGQAHLSSNASNLVDVLDRLHAYRARFDEYQRSVQQILPDLTYIAVAPAGGGTKEVRLFFGAPESREDLALRLDQVGTGTGNILALVYAIVASQENRLIIVDEINEHLHPGATRALFRLMRQHPRHQYIISTHLIGALDELPDSDVVLLRRHSTSTAALSVDARAVSDQRMLLEALGVSLQDIFAMDRVLWVEGPTEAEVFRLVATKLKLPPRFAILPVVATGDLEGRYARLIADIYHQLSSAGSLLPTTIAFILDTEYRSAAAQADLVRQTRGITFFLSGVAMLEGLFLEPEIVARFLRELLQERGMDSTITSSDIETYWNRLLDPSRYKISISRQDDLLRWRSLVHAARVLEDTVDEFSNQRLAYDKIRHGTRIARMCWETDRNLLKPIEEVLRRALNTAPE